MEKRWTVHLWHWIGFLLIAIVVIGAILSGSAQIALLLLAVLPGVGLIVTIIGQRQMQASLRRKEEALKKQQLEFAQNVNHELRHPLTLVLGCVELLSDGGLSDEARQRMLQTLHRHTHGLVERVEMITAFQELPGSRLRLEPVDIYELVKKAIQEISQDARRSGITFYVDRQTGPSVTVGDGAWLSLALRYLFENAIKFSPGGGTVLVRLYTTGDEICVEVMDEGIGIPASQMKRIFEPFQQGDGSASRRFEGVGLGLTVARQVAEAHGGWISAKSGGEQQGSIFTLAVPMVLPIKMTEPTLMFQVVHERWDGGKTTSPRCA